MNYVLSPSILAADFKVLGQEMKNDRGKWGSSIFILTLWTECLYQVYHLDMPVLASIRDCNGAVHGCTSDGRRSRSAM